MLREHDERAKLIAENTLDALGEVRREVEVPSFDSQRIDLWFRRTLYPRDLPEHLVLLDQLFPWDCMIEAYAQALGFEDFWESLRKQYGWRHYLQQQLRKDAPDAPLVPPPFLWFLSAGRPDSLMKEYVINRWAGFPEGIYRWEPALRLGLIVVNELPRGSSTLLLRLMGSTAVRRDALLELRLLDPRHPDTILLKRIVSALRHTFSRAKNIQQELREEFMTAAWAEFERYEQEVEQKGEQKGRKGGLIEAVLDLCEVFGISLTEPQRDQLQRMDIPALTSLRTHLKLYRAWPSE